MTTPFISVEGLTRRFPEATGKSEFTVFEDLGFGVEEGEFACVIGHSGCGKSTIQPVSTSRPRATSWSTGLRVMFHPSSRPWIRWAMRAAREQRSDSGPR